MAPREPADLVIVPDADTLEGLEALREAAAKKQAPSPFDVAKAAHWLESEGYTPSARWVEEHGREYANGLRSGFAIEKASS